MVKVRAAQVEALPTLEFHARGVAGDGEGEGVALHVRPARLEDGGGEDDDLVGEGGQRREHARAADQQPRLVLLDDARGQEGVGLLADRLGAVGLRVDQRVREAEVALADVLVVGADVVAVARVVAVEKLRGGGHRHQRDVEVVGRAPDHPAAVVGPVLHHRPPARQVLARLRRQEGQPDRLAARRRLVGHRLAQGRVVLHVVEVRDRARGVARGRVGRHVLDALPAEPDLRLRLAQTLKVLLAGTRSHRSPPEVRSEKGLRSLGRRPLRIVSHFSPLTSHFIPRRAAGCAAGRSRCRCSWCRNRIRSCTRRPRARCRSPSCRRRGSAGGGRSAS